MGELLSRYLNDIELPRGKIGKTYEWKVYYNTYHLYIYLISYSWNVQNAFQLKPDLPNIL